MSDLDPKLVEVFASVLKISEDDITTESSPRNLDRWDSMRHVELVIAVEEAFGITFGTTEIMSMKTVANFQSALNEHSV